MKCECWLFKVLTEEAGTELCWKKKNSKARLIPKAGSGEGGGLLVVLPYVMFGC